MAAPQKIRHRCFVLETLDMPNRSFHCIFATLTVSGALLIKESNEGQKTIKPLIGGAFAGMLGSLPDKLEPSLGNPNHRQFFHSLTLAGVIGYYGWETWNWQTQNEWEEVLKVLILAGCGAYLSHLIADAFTPRSLPFMGNINF